MIAITDVDYRDDAAVAACVAFQHWGSRSATLEVVKLLPPAAPYEPGAFYKRELPCLLEVIPPQWEYEAVIVDGHAWLEQGKPGLGAHLYEALAKRYPVVGIAKTPYAGGCAQRVLRGSSATAPLYVTEVGMDAEAAAALVNSMHGSNRLPTMVKRVDQLARAG